MARAPSNIVYLESPEKGVDGRGWISMARDPVISDGRIGDMWFNTLTHYGFGPKTAGGWGAGTYLRGPNGWTALTRVVSDGTRRVRQIYDWTGGGGTKPATGYEGATGTVPDVEDAVDYRGPEGPQSLINALDAKTDDVTYETLTALAESASDNEKAAIKRVFEAGGSMPFRSRAEAQATIIPAAVKSVATQFYAPSYAALATLAGGARYRRVSEEPEHDLKFRSADRWTVEGASDSAHGGWWEIAEEVLMPEMVGVTTGIGAPHCDDALSRVLSAADKLERSVLIPDGIYNLNGTVGVQLTKRGLSVSCGANTYFKAASGFDPASKIIQVDAPAGLGAVFEWRGGIIDGTDRPAGAPGTAPDMMYITGPGLKKVDISGCWMKNNETWTGSAGDSCLFIAECDDINIHSNIFQGGVDCGVYISGDNTETYGKRVRVYGNTFIECGSACLSKRLFESHIISGNNFRKCDYGFATAEAGALYPGTKVIVAENEFVEVAYPIELRVADGSVIANNRIEDFGRNHASEIVVSRAINISGSKNCVISGNKITMTGLFAPHPASIGVYFRSRVQDGVTYHSTGNLAIGNHIDNVPTGLREEDANQDNNKMFLNVVLGTNARHSIFGPTSTYIDSVDATLSISNAEVNIGGLGAAAALRVFRAQNSVNYLRAQGAASGMRPTLSFVGSDTNVDGVIGWQGGGRLLFGANLDDDCFRLKKPASGLSWNRVEITGTLTGTAPSIVAAGGDAAVDLVLSGKGTGHLRWGTWAANSDAAINGYITMKDAAGNVRKIPTIE